MFTTYFAETIGHYITSPEEHQYYNDIMLMDYEQLIAFVARYSETKATNPHLERVVFMSCTKRLNDCIKEMFFQRSQQQQRQPNRSSMVDFMVNYAAYSSFYNSIVDALTGKKR